jgi:N-acetylmuramic acid 6-phosphate etherase
VNTHHVLTGTYLDTLTTESVDPRYADLDTLSIPDLVAAMNEAEAQVPLAVRAVLPQINEAIEGISGRLAMGGRLFYVGAGTPGRLGVLDASECPPTFSVDPALVQGVIAGGPGAIVEAVEGAEDDDAAGAALVAGYGIGPLDAVVGISASGRTPYVLGAVRAAREVGALTAGISCNAGAELTANVDFGIEVVVGPEVLAGSTRLKAGSAQKQVLNMISTISMIRLGKTYGNLMVDLRATNDKLHLRARLLVERLTGVGPDEAEAALDLADQHVSTATIMVLRGLDRPAAEAALHAAGGRLRTALDS